MKVEIGGPPDSGANAHYERGYKWGKEARGRYGNDACEAFLKKYANPSNSYERGVVDAIGETNASK